MAFLSSAAHNCDALNDHTWPRDYGFFNCRTVLYINMTQADSYPDCLDRAEGVMVASTQPPAGGLFLGSYNYASFLLTGAAIISMFFAFEYGATFTKPDMFISPDGYKIIRSVFYPMGQYSTILSAVLSVLYLIPVTTYTFSVGEVYGNVEAQPGHKSFPNTPYTGLVALAGFLVCLFFFWGYLLTTSQAAAAHPAAHPSQIIHPIIVVRRNPLDIEFGPSKSSRHRIRTRVGSAVIRPNPVDIGFGSPAQPESMIRRNPVVIEFGSESAAQPFAHRKTVVIHVGSESKTVFHRKTLVIKFKVLEFGPESESKGRQRGHLHSSHPAIEIQPEPQASSNLNFNHDSESDIIQLEFPKIQRLSNLNFNHDPESDSIQLEFPQPIRSLHPGGMKTTESSCHRIQPEPPTRSQTSSNLNFMFTYHPSESVSSSENSSHPIGGPVYPPSKSSRHPSAWPTPPRVIRIGGPVYPPLKSRLSYIRLGRGSRLDPREGPPKGAPSKGLLQITKSLRNCSSAR